MPEGEFDRIAPHKPVHLSRDLSTRLDDPADPYILEIFDAQQAWDDAVGGDQIIINQGDIADNLPYDAIIVDGDPGTPMSVPIKAHNGMEATFQFDAGDGIECVDPLTNCWAGYVLHLPEEGSPIDQQMKVVVLHTNFYVGFFTPPVRWWVTTHELGHVLGLADHEVTCGTSDRYRGIMADGCLEPGADFQIWNLTDPVFFLVPDEASCVREIFDLPGKQGCEP